MKKIALLLGLVASVVLFAGCAAKQPPVADTSTPVAQPAPVKKDLKGESI
jgi:uncharacterized lipoprotein YajG